MEKRSLILIIVIGLLLVGAVAASFYRFFVAQDYLVQGQTECDPAEAVCFGFEVDCEEDPAACLSDTPSIEYYTYYQRLARHMPVCDPAHDPACNPLACGSNEPGCRTWTCNAETVSEGEICSNPEEFMRKDLEEKQSSEACDPFDPTCETPVTSPESHPSDFPNESEF